jgi:hypothetical protein
VETTYLLHLRVVLVLTMVWSRTHHLRHQWPQISTFASLNHIHQHPYFKISYVHIQVFHILHHHTIKLLQAFKSFLPGVYCRKSTAKLIRCWPPNSTAKTVLLQGTQFSSKSWFAAGHTIRHRKLVRCKPQNSMTAKTSSLQATQFNSESWFAAGHTIRQRIINLL